MSQNKTRRLKTHTQTAYRIIAQMPFSDVHLLSYNLMRLIQTALACALMVSCPFPPPSCRSSSGCGRCLCPVVVWASCSDGAAEGSAVRAPTSSGHCQPNNGLCAHSKLQNSCCHSSKHFDHTDQSIFISNSYSRYFEIWKTTLWNIMFKAYIMTLILQPPKYNTN